MGVTELCLDSTVGLLNLNIDEKLSKWADNAVNMLMLFLNSTNYVYSISNSLSDLVSLQEGEKPQAKLHKDTVITNYQDIYSSLSLVAVIDWKRL